MTVDGTDFQIRQPSLRTEEIVNLSKEDKKNLEKVGTHTSLKVLVSDMK
jgi:hypothetical protein